MTIRTLAAIVMLAAIPSRVAAQTSPPAPGPAPAGPTISGLAELRLGGLWPQPPLVSDPTAGPASSSSFVAGGQFGFNFPQPLGGRVGLHFLVDYASLGGSEYTDDLLGLVRREGHWFVFTPAISLDLVRSSRLSLGIRTGPSIVGEITTFLLERAQPSCTYTGTYSSCEGPFDNVCDLSAFEDRCTERYRGALALGAAVRWHPHATWPLHVGLDYTWLSYGRRVVVATIGVSTRY